MSQDGRDNRKAPRVSVLGHAVIITPTGRANCVIRDLSKTGAKLGVTHTIKLPAAFDLYLVKTKSKRRAILRWRTGDFAGVEFCQHTAGALTDATSDEDVWIA